MSPPLSYPSMKAVLTHMDPNFRLDISRRIPSARVAALSVPCKMKSFEPKKHSFKINNLEYKIGIIRHYVGAEPPEWVQKTNDEGGFTRDHGVFGMETDPESEPPTDRETFQKFKNEQKLRKVLQLLNQNNVPSVKESLEKEAKSLRKRIVRYQNNLAYSELKILYFIQLSVSDKEGTIIHQERIHYSVPLKMAFNYLIDKIFGWNSENTKNYTHSLNISGKTNFRDVFKIKVLDPKMEVILEEGCLKQVTFEEHAPVFRNIVDGNVYVENEIVHLAMKILATDFDEALQLVFLLCQGLINERNVKRINDRRFPIEFRVRFRRHVSMTVSIKDVSTFGRSNLFFVEIKKNV